MFGDWRPLSDREIDEATRPRQVRQRLPGGSSQLVELPPIDFHSDPRFRVHEPVRSDRQADSSPPDQDD